MSDTFLNPFIVLFAYFIFGIPMKLFTKLIFLTFLGLSSMLQAAKAIPYTILVTDKDGHSYFKAASEELNPAKVGLTTRMIPVNNVFFGEGTGKEQDWHNPSQRLFVIVLSGVMQIETSSGETKNFRSGEILLLEDLTGKGHKTRNLNGEPVSYLAFLLE